jgi:hypothetical protein
MAANAESANNFRIIAVTPVDDSAGSALSSGPSQEIASAGIFRRRD